MDKLTKKVLEEDWDYYAIQTGNDPTGEGAVRARIGSIAPEALRLLLKAEWVAASGSLCPWCGGLRPYEGATPYDNAERGHKPGCEWLATIGKAGLR